MDPVSIFGALSAVISTVRSLYKLVHQILRENDINETSEQIRYLVRELTDTYLFLQQLIETSEKMSKLREKYGELEGSSDQSSTRRDGLKLPVTQLEACLKEVKKQMPKLVERDKERKVKWWIPILNSGAAKDKKITEKLLVDVRYYRENLERFLSVLKYQDIANMQEKINEMEKRSSSWTSRVFQKFKRLAKKFCNKLKKIWNLFSRRALKNTANNASYSLH